MAAMVRAERDPSLSARVVGRRTLPYEEGPSEAEDRPAFVRAASGLAWVDGELAIVQDDAAFIGVRTRDGRVRAFALPRGEGGRRRFEERLGNRLSKLDLECCVSLPGKAGERLLAFGSGSLPVRQALVVTRLGPSDEPKQVPAAPLYERIRSALGLGSRPTNIEGATIVGGVLRLFHRGVPAASIDLDLDELVEWLARDGAAPHPTPRGATTYALGEERGVPFSFTAASTLQDGRVIFLAAAEDTDDPVLDGVVLGSRFGVLEDGRARFTELCDENGERVTDKAEGLAPDPDRACSFFVAVDPDDPDRAAELLDVRTDGL